MKPVGRCTKCGREFLTLPDHMTDKYLEWATNKQRGPVCNGRIEPLPDEPTPGAASSGGEAERG
jgi:hypothetical protein